MNLSFTEILVVFVVGMIFFKPHEIKTMLQRVFSFKNSVEEDIKKITEEAQSVEFFEVKEPCQKQQ